ncbi:carboxypeptidase-like regulatory domain-containing protein [Curtobacterium sp. PhB136]|uniref:carboxypeptidase-like regulatory domain-containing protein n=1 Tax=Curtobacterium sp. PhB136 TaxID=2485181 RepID=UPI0010F37FEA|nr:carboxypeptidase-like regulatory domain-containing protein [Curtobacterium sp. PhB136]TCK65693.1 carboxypeptidase family protein [Curtobacterium sp. PhB136]
MTARRWTTVGITTAMTLIGVLVAPVTAATAAPADGALTVMLTDPDKQPLAMEGVAVDLRAADGSTEASATSDQRGRLTFEDVPAGTWTLHGEREGSYGFDDVIPAERTGVVVAPGSHDAVVLVVRRGASIGGTAHNPYGADLSGAAVVVRGWNTGTVKRTVTAPDGHYWVHGLPSDDYSVQVNAHDETLDSWPALRSLSWGFHRDPGSTAERAYVRVAHQAVGRTETVVDGIDGSATQGVSLGAIVNPQLDTDFTNARVHVYGESIGSTFDTTMTYWTPGRGGLFGVVLSAGRYKVEVVGWSPSQRKDVSYWYGGEGNRPVADRASSHTVVMAADQSRTINFWSTR